MSFLMTMLAAASVPAVLWTAMILLDTTTTHNDNGFTTGWNHAPNWTHFRRTILYLVLPSSASAAIMTLLGVSWSIAGLFGTIFVPWIIIYTWLAYDLFRSR